MRKAKAEEEKVKIQSQVQRSGFHYSARVKQLKTNWSRVGARLKSDNLRRGCSLLIEAHCKGGVRADSMSSLIVAVGERHGSLGVGFENMRRSWIIQ